MPSPRQLALEIQINEKASLDNFYVSKNNLKTINILKSLINQEDMGAQIFIDDYGSNGKTYLLQAICNDFANKSQSSIYIPLQKFIKLETSLLSGVEGLDLICIDDVHLISNHKEWELALFNLINECYEKDCFLILSGNINQFKALPDLTSRVKKMEILTLKQIHEDELLDASQVISKT